jgi:uncharacterized membrane protein
MTTRRTFGRTLRNKFIAGLVVLIPFMLTIKALWWLFTYVDGLAQPIGAAIFGRPIAGLGFLLTITIVFLAGFLMSAGPLKRMLSWFDESVHGIPLVGSVYGTTKKVLAGFGKEDSASAFQRFVFARLPGRTAPAFVMGTFVLARADNTNYTLCTVYVPTNHLYVGDVVILPVEDVIDTDLTVEDGVSMLLSAGSSVPPLVTEK